MKITLKQLNKIIQEQIEFHKSRDSFSDGSVAKNSKKYPELQKIAKEIAKNVGQQINQKVKNVKSEMPYKAQHVLEELIKILQKSV